MRGWGGGAVSPVPGWSQQCAPDTGAEGNTDIILSGEGTPMSHVYTVTRSLPCTHIYTHPPVMGMDMIHSTSLHKCM